MEFVHFPCELKFKSGHFFDEFKFKNNLSAQAMKITNNGRIQISNPCATKTSWLGGLVSLPIDYPLPLTKFTRVVPLEP